MALSDKFAVNVAGDMVDVVVVFEGYTNDSNGWQTTFQVVELATGGAFMSLENGMSLCWPTSKREACSVMSDQMAKAI